MAQDQLNSKIVVIGGSAGSLEALLDMLPALRVDLDIPIVIVMHRKTAPGSPLVDVLAIKSSLPVCEVEEKEPVKNGHIYIAPADYHLLFEADHTFSLDVSEKVNYSRPSIDVAFESAAEVYSAGLTGILLSGANADGTHGLKVIGELGGVTIAQDPDTAEISYMPEHAINNHVVHHIMNVQQLAAYINSL